MAMNVIYLLLYCFFVSHNPVASSPEDVIRTNNLDRGQVKCRKDGQGISIKLLSSDFPGYEDRSHLLLGTCPFNSDGSVSGTAEECQLDKKIDGEIVTYSADLTSAEEKHVITRRNPVKVFVACSYCCLEANEAVSLDPKFGVIVGKVKRKGYTLNYPLTMRVLSNTGVVMGGGSTVSGDIGAIVTVRLEGSPDSMKVRAEKCWCTPDDANADRNKHMLIENSCISDRTVQTTPVGKNWKSQDISFRLFAFEENPTASVEIHCDLIACKLDESCGVCEKKPTTSAPPPQFPERIIEGIGVPGT